MSDLTERLRELYANEGHAKCDEAADELDRFEQDYAQLKLINDRLAQHAATALADVERGLNRIAALEADLTQAVQMYTDAAGERDKALADLAAAQSYATTLAVSMHKQHYADAAPNWQPLPDLVGLLTQIDNMYAGVRNDLEAAEVENKRLVGMNLMKLRNDLAAAQAALASSCDEQRGGEMGLYPCQRAMKAEAEAAALRAVTPEMVKAYLEANDEYWRIQDAQALPPMKWRKGTPQQATEYSLTKMFAAIEARKGGS